MPCSEIPIKHLTPHLPSDFPDGWVNRSDTIVNVTKFTYQGYINNINNINVITIKQKCLIMVYQHSFYDIEKAIFFFQFRGNLFKLLH